MQVKVGSIYRDKTTGVEFITILHRYDADTSKMEISFVNIKNWSVSATLTGTQLTDGTISCRDLDADNYEKVSNDLHDHYRSNKS